MREFWALGIYFFPLSLSIFLLAGQTQSKPKDKQTRHAYFALSLATFFMYDYRAIDGLEIYGIYIYPSNEGKRVFGT